MRERTQFGEATSIRLWHFRLGSLGVSLDA